MNTRTATWIILCLIVVAAVALAMSFVTATHAHAAPIPILQPPHCQTIEKLKNEAKGAKFTALTPGQFHFMAGVYVASPVTPPGGMPPGDGALLVEMPGHAGIVWTRGAQACITIIVLDIERHAGAYVPLPVDTKLLAILRAINTGVGETSSPDDSSEERKL